MNTISNSICIIGAYFGQFNNYFDLWLKSCERNPEIDFYIFGDAKYEKQLPSNVYIVYMSLESLKERASNYLGFQVCLDTPYKCCDYKPIYGGLFRDYIEQYEYWGHCDFDLIFGDILSCLKKNNYQKYDKFFALGHLSFYRNIEAVHNYIKLDGSAVNYRDVYTSPKSFAFDEMGCIVQLYLHNELPFFTKRLFADIAEPERYYRFRHSEYCYVNEGPLKNHRHQIFYWENGKVFCAYFEGDTLRVKEYCYIHFKHRPNFSVNFDISAVKAFYITPCGFIERKHECITKELIQQLNPISRIPFYETFEFVCWKLRKLYKSVIGKL